MDPERVPVITSWILLPTIVVSLVSQSLIPVFAVNILLYIVFLYGLIEDWFDTSHLPLGVGVPNLITVLRGGATIYILLIYTEIDKFWVSLILFLLYGMDKADGMAALILNQRSRIGELMDVESDALLTVYILFWLHFEGVVLPILLIIAPLRYIYVVLLDNIELPVKKERRKRFSAVISTIFLCAWIWYWAYPVFLIEVIGLTTAALTGLTFVRDFYDRIK